MADGLTPAQRRRLVQADRAQMMRLRNATAAQVRAVFDRLGEYRESTIPQFVEQAVPIVQRSQTIGARLRASFLSRVVGANVPVLDPQNVTGAAVRNGTPPEVVYTRPFSALFRGMGDGKTFAQARDEASQRAGNLADTDVMLAYRQANVDTAEAVNADRRNPRKIEAFKRVSDGGCNFCELAATQRYWTNDLQPLHDHCGCGVDVLDDPSEQVIDAEKLYKLRAESVEVRRRRDDGTTFTIIYGEKSTPNYDWESQVPAERRAEIDAQFGTPPADAPAPAVAIREHGELGPVLVNPEQTFTGPADIPKRDFTDDWARLGEGYRDAAAEALAASRDASLPESSRREFFDKAAELLGKANEYKRRSEQ